MGDKEVEELSKTYPKFRSFAGEVEETGRSHHSGYRPPVAACESSLLSVARWGCGYAGMFAAVRAFERVVRLRLRAREARQNIPAPGLG